MARIERGPREADTPRVSRVEDERIRDRDARAGVVVTIALDEILVPYRPKAVKAGVNFWSTLTPTACLESTSPLLARATGGSGPLAVRTA
jgi:hypothetical protein